MQWMYNQLDSLTTINQSIYSDFSELTGFKKVWFVLNIPLLKSFSNVTNVNLTLYFNFEQLQSSINGLTEETVHSSPCGLHFWLDVCLSK